MIITRLNHGELPSGAAPGTVVLRVIEVVWNQYELRSGVTQNTSELLVALIDETHAKPCSCAAEDTSALDDLQLVSGPLALISSAGHDTLTLHTRVTDVGHNIELSSDAPRHVGIEA